MKKIFAIISIITVLSGLTGMVNRAIAPTQPITITQSSTHDSLGTKVGKAIATGLTKEFTKKVDYSKIDPCPYPYETDNSKNMEAATKQGVNAGMKALDNMEQSNKNAIKEGLNNLK